MTIRPSIRAIVLLVLVALSSPASADPKAAAKDHLARATELHAEEKFAEALDELTAAYKLDPQPPILYAIGQLHVKLGDCPLAIKFYQRFIKARPGRSAAAAAREAIAICKKQPPPPATSKVEPVVEPPEPTPPAPEPAIDPAPEPVREPAPAPEASPPPEPPPEAPPAPLAPPQVVMQSRPWYTDVLGDLLLGVGIASGVASVLMYSAAVSDLDAAESATTYDRATELRDDARTKRMYAVGFAAGGVVLTGVAIVRFLTHDRREERRIVIVPQESGGVIAVTGRF